MIIVSFSDFAWFSNLIKVAVRIVYFGIKIKLNLVLLGLKMFFTSVFYFCCLIFKVLSLDFTLFVCH